MLINPDRRYIFPIRIYWAVTLPPLAGATPLGSAERYKGMSINIGVNRIEQGYENPDLVGFAQ
jgi:hypothetical protein